MNRLLAALLLAAAVTAAPAATPCATEDSTNCFWDAQHRGNGEGRSFLDIDGTAHYLP